jgi:glycogen synthase
MDVHAPFSGMVLEASWEVCNKVGGIYTVVSSKVLHMIERYSENYLTIGPYVSHHAATEFVPGQAPPHIEAAIRSLEPEGIKCTYGTWDVKGRPACILIDFSEMMADKDTIKTEFWERFRIDSLGAPYDYDEPLVWSVCVGKLAQALAEHGQVILHAHEWLAGGAILYTKTYAPQIATVFTTHATMLGRSISGTWGNLYEILDTLDDEEAARTLNVTNKHHTEKAAAHAADVFTTVSQVTGIEAERILHKKPDLILPNGLDYSTFPDNEEIPIKHREHREHIHEFLMAYFFPYYAFDLEHTLLMYVSGRYEYTNKGVDITIAALGRLNRELKNLETDRTIVVFFFIPAGIQTIRYDLLESKALFEDVQDEFANYMVEMRKRLISGFAHRQLPSDIRLFDEDFGQRMKRMLHRFAKEGLPALTTHHIMNEEHDQLLRDLRQHGLLNRAEDRIKAVFYPGYLSRSDGLLNLDYHQAVMGCHLGIFPSYYEPWGYTPMESAGYGVPAITTDLAGLGAYMLTNDIPQTGISVLKRRDKHGEEIIEPLKELIKGYALMDRHERLELKHKAIALSHRFDWEYLVANYFEAHELALHKRHP